MYRLTFSIEMNVLAKIAYTALLLGGVASCISAPNQSCSPNWKITGFYTPIEQEFQERQFTYINVGNRGLISFQTEFIKEVKMEGWGKTRYGWYLGFHGHQWHQEKAALNAQGRPLEMGAIAVDNKFVLPDARVHIPSLGPILGLTEFVAVDVGTAVRNRHIDVYAGEGSQAKSKSYQLTGERTVCFRR